MSNYLQGELVVDSVSIVNPEKESVDILKLTTNITIFESINTPFLSGRISVVDALEISQMYKLIGQESLTIKIRQREGVRNELSTPKYSIDKTFRIYSITDVETINDVAKAYVIHFTDPKWFICQKTKINECLRGSYSDMLLKVLKENAGFQMNSTVIDKWDKSSPGHHQMIVPGWNINKFIDFIVNNANPEENDSWKNSMFFYQTLNGGFRFDSFQSMTSRTFGVSFDTMPRNSHNSEEIDINAPGIGLNTQILGHKTEQKFNTMIGVNSGAYSSKLKSYDPVRKLEEENVYSIKDVFSRGNGSLGHTSSFPVIRMDQPEVTYAADDMISSRSAPEIGESTIDLSPEISYDAFVVNKVNMTNAFSDEAKLIDATGDKNINQTKGQEYRDTGLLERNALLSILSQNSVGVSIPFRSDMSVGTMVELNFLTAELKKDSSSADSIMDNRYLIAKIVTSIDPLANKGTLLLHAVKDSHGVDVKTYNPIEEALGPQED